MLEPVKFQIKTQQQYTQKISTDRTLMSYLPDPCINCAIVPQELLTIPCHHNLCLECAAARLYLSLKHNIYADTIACEFCQRTIQLNSQSLDILTPYLITEDISNSSQSAKEQHIEEDQKQYPQPDFYQLLKNNNIRDETINILAGEEISSLNQLRQCTQESLKMIGIKLSEVLKLKKI